MSAEILDEAVERIKWLANPHGERRRHPRFSLAQRVRVRPCDTREADFTDFQTTINVARHGLYFLTEERRYQVGMEVVVTSPFDEEAGGMNAHYLGRVTRIVEMPDGRRGVAIHLSLHMQVNP